jgi:methionyl aminopeptidase
MAEITIKTTEDIEKLRVGGRKLRRILKTLGEKAVPGISTGELNRLCEEMIREDGDTPAFLGYKPRGAKIPFPAALCVCINEEVVHGIPDNKRILEEGDIVSVDAGLVHEGMVTDSSLTVAVGQLDKRGQKLIATAEGALQAGIWEARAGNKIGDISAAIQKYVEDAGFSLVVELGGHGVGYKIHEAPDVPNVGKKGTGPLLVPGMVIAIEPILAEKNPSIFISDDGYTIFTEDGGRGAIAEHTVLITDGDPEIITADEE